MNRIIAAALVFSTLGAGVALAQTTTTSPSTVSPAVTPATTPTQSSTMPSAVTTNSTATTTAAPVAGANSFTMAQAQKRIEDQGYTQVSALAKDDKSIWRGHAMKDGKTVDVALDYQGHVTSN
jgi:zona occludens toxin (predicted ATPase)